MSFLDSDEHLILMDCNPTPYNACPARETVYDDLLKLKDVGIRTASVHTIWRSVEPEMGKVRWKAIDDQIEKCLKAGLKVLAMAPIMPPLDAHPDYYLKYANGQLETLGFSIWHPDAMEYQRKFLEKMMRRYRSSQVQVILGEIGYGEKLLKEEGCLFDRSAVAQRDHYLATHPGTKAVPDWLRQSVINHFMYMQEVLYPQHGEIWDAMHYMIGRVSENTGNRYQRDVYQAYRERWPDVQIHLVQYTYIGHVGRQDYISYIDGLNADGVNIIIEADYPRGLARTTPLAIEKGFRGQIVGAVHPFGGSRERVSDEQLDQIKQSIEQWQATHDGDD